MSKPKISIVTACYNSEKHIEETIKSVKCQSYDNLEYIIIDGASSDSTMEIVECYADNTNVIISEPDNGVYDAFNKGISAATGEIVYFLNSDDFLYETDTINGIIDAFMQNPELKIVYGNVLILDDATGYKHIKGRKLTLSDLKAREMMPHQGAFVKRELFDKFGLFDIEYDICSDYDFMIKCFKHYEQDAMYINRVVAVCRDGGISTNAKYRYLLEKEANDILRVHFDISRDVEIAELQKVQGLYRVWLESLLLRGAGISKAFHKYNIKNIAIFGTMKTALYLQEDLIKEGFNVVAFLDNNPNMQGEVVKDRTVYHPSWLSSNMDKVDAVVLSIESNKDGEIKDHLIELTNGRILILSWKELAEQVLDERL